jgi:hypothetical protein
MKLSDFIKELQEIQTGFQKLNFPDPPVVMASDEEGNSFHEVTDIENTITDFIIIWPGGMEIELEWE